MKKRFNKLLLCGLMVCSLAVPAGLADEVNAEDSVPEAPPPATQAPATQAPATPEPVTPAPATPVPETPVPATPVPATEEPTSEPTQEAASTPTEEPSSMPTQEPTADLTSEPTSEPTQEPTAEPTSEPTSEPTQEPTAEPTAEPTPVPTQEPTPVPTQEPTPEPSQGPTFEPTQEPSSEPTLAPTPEATIEPGLEPSASPSVSPDPAATPLPIPGGIDGLVNITPEGAAQQENGVWKIQLSAPDGPLAFVWTVSGEATSHLVYTQTGQDAAVFIAETPDTRIVLSSANYVQGQHTLYVGAVLADGSVTWGSILFELASQQSGFPGGFSGAFTGGRPGGGMSKGGASGAALQEEQGFRITPGKALTSKHASGTKNTASYTCSEIDDSAEAITALVLESTQTEITLEGGAAFFVSKDDGKLQLIPESEGKEWQLNALAMNTLAESGIDRVVFHVGSTAYSMPTRMDFSGSVYASLRAKGYVSKDMEICVDALGVHVYVDGCSYSINDHGELVPCEE